MRSSIDDLRRSPTPLLVTSRQSLVDAIKAAHVAVLRAAKLLTNESSLDVATVTGLRRYALWLEDVALETNLHGAEQESALNLCATIYELLGSLPGNQDSGSIFAAPLNDLLRGAVLGSFTSYQAQASMLGRRLRERLAVHLPANTADAVDLAVALTVAALVGRSFQDAFTIGSGLEQLGSAAVRALREQDAPNAGYLDLDRMLALGLACRAASAGMLVGSAGLLDAAEQQLGALARVALASQHEHAYWLAQRLARVVRQMQASGMHRRLGSARLPVEFRRALARDGVFELWEPQLQAIRKGLLEKDSNTNFVVSIPTGAGKTLIAELAILAALSGKAQAWAVYVTPSRALVNQVSNDLRRRLTDCGIAVRTVLAGAEQNALLREELELITESRSVTVLTPEKLDAYYRNARELFDTCKLIVFDECHKVAEPGRGPLLESLITRFSLLQPNARLVLLSGVLSNTGELTEWLGRERTAVISARRRPTRQVRGVAVRHSEVPREPRASGSGTSRRVDFSGGVTLVHEAEDLAESIEVQLPSLFRGYYTQDSSPRGWRERRSGGRSGPTEHARQLAEVLARAPGTTLVFVQQSDWAESCCRQVTPPPAQGDDQRERLAQFLVGELGASHELAKWVRTGVAFHHARLPSAAQRAVELGLEQGWLKLVFATPTLREGLNTAATNVILAGHSYWDEPSGERLEVREADFENLAGRAGRPLRDTEGVVLLVPDSLAEARAVEAGRHYLLMDEEALRVRSQLGHLSRVLRDNEGDMARLPESEQSLLLGLTVAGLDDENKLRAFFEQSLWSVQEDDEEKITAAARASSVTLTQTRQSVGDDRLLVAGRTGLALSSVEALTGALSSTLEVFLTPGAGPTPSEQSAMLRTLLHSLAGVPEIHRGALRSLASNPDRHILPVELWIAGAPYDEIHRAVAEAGVIRENPAFGHTVRYCSDVSTWLSWGLGACFTVLSALAPTPNVYVGNLPLLVKYGVPSAVEAYLSLLGVSDRSLARTLGAHFANSGRAAALGEVAAWLTEVGERLGDLFPERDLRGELLRRQVFGRRPQSLPYRLAEFAVEEPIKVGQLVEPVDVSATQVLGLARDKQVGHFLDPLAVRAFSRGRVSGVRGIVLIGASPGETVVLALVVLSH